MGAVLFDLFGTLVGPFSRAGNTAALEVCAELAGLDPDQCVTRWIDLYDKRVRGEVAGIRGHLDVCASAAGLRIDSSAMAAAEESYGAFVSDLLEPAANAIEFLRAIANAGHRVGVLSNCHHDVARIVRDGPFGGLVDVWEFSCETGLRKPSSAAYAHALRSFRAQPDETVFVGDGSDDELSGAEAAGLSPVLVVTDLADVYDPDRPDATSWSGLSGHGLLGVQDIVLSVLERGRSNAG